MHKIPSHNNYSSLGYVPYGHRMSINTAAVALGHENRDTCVGIYLYYYSIYIFYALSE